MTCTIGNVAAELARQFCDYERGIVATVTAVVGNAYTITDTVWMETQENDHWNGAKIMYLTGTLAWTLHTVTDYVGATNSLVISGSAAPVAGDEFLLFIGRTTAGRMLGAINDALRGMRIMREDESLAVVDEQVEYDLPAGVSDVRVVELLNEEDLMVYEHRHWEEYDGTLRFYAYVPDSRHTTIRLKYAGMPDSVEDFADTAEVPEKRLMAEAAYALMMDELKNGQVDKRQENQWKNVEANYYLMRSRFPIYLQPKIKGRML